MQIYLFNVDLHSHTCSAVLILYFHFFMATSWHISIVILILYSQLFLATSWLKCMQSTKKQLMLFAMSNWEGRNLRQYCNGYALHLYL